MENLLDKHGWKFEALYKNKIVRGHISVKGGRQAGNMGYVTLFFNDTELYGDFGTPRDLENAGIINFRLLEPGEPESKEIECKRCEGYGQIKKFKGPTIGCPDCDGTGTIKKEEHDASKQNEAKEPAYPAGYNHTDKETIRRETATQFACAIIKNSHDKNYQRNTVNDGWWGNHVLDEAIALTDELLSKLNSK